MSFAPFCHGGRHRLTSSIPTGRKPSLATFMSAVMPSESPTQVRRQILITATLVAFLMYLDRICLANIIGSDSFQRDIQLAPGQSVPDLEIRTQGTTPGGAGFRANAVGPLGQPVREYQADAPLTLELVRGVFEEGKGW